MSENEKAKTSLDNALNFDDLGSQKKTKKRARKPAAKMTSAGIVLGIPVDDSWYPKGWLNKDIMHVNAEEFVRWARLVWGPDLTKYQNMFEDPKKRLQMFNKILIFHKHSLFQRGKDSVDLKVVN